MKNLVMCLSLGILSATALAKDAERQPSQHVNIGKVGGQSPSEVCGNETFSKIKAIPVIGDFESYLLKNVNEAKINTPEKKKALKEYAEFRSHMFAIVDEACIYDGSK